MYLPYLIVPSTFSPQASSPLECSRQKDRILHPLFLTLSYLFFHWARGALPAGATLLGWPNYGVDGRLNKLTNQQIWLFSAGGRRGTKFYVGSPLGNLNPLSTPWIKKSHDFPLPKNKELAPIKSNTLPQQTRLPPAPVLGTCLGHRGAWLEWMISEEITRCEITIKWVWKLWALI